MNQCRAAIDLTIYWIKIWAKRGSVTGFSRLNEGQLRVSAHPDPFPSQLSRPDLIRITFPDLQVFGHLNIWNTPVGTEAAFWCDRRVHIHNLLRNPNRGA